VRAIVPSYLPSESCRKCSATRWPSLFSDFEDSPLQVSFENAWFNTVGLEILRFVSENREEGTTEALELKTAALKSSRI